MARKKIKSATDQRPFVIVYQDFLESDLLDNCYQKLIFIYLKKFSDEKNQCFPSIKKLSEMTKIGITRVKKTILELEEKGVISKQERTRTDGGKSSNLYTLYDYSEIWESVSSTEIEEIKKNKKFDLQEIPTELLLSELGRREKEKGLASDPTKDQKQVPKQNLQEDNNIILSESQEKYSMEELKIKYNYDIIITDFGVSKDDVDTVFNILYDILNSENKTIRVEGANRYLDVVKTKLTNLSYENIVYVIEKYKCVTERIRSPRAYMISMLYNAREQMELDYVNMVNN